MNADSRVRQLGFLKALFLPLVLCSGFLLSATADASAQSYRERVADYLLFYYVGFPNNDHPNYKPVLLDNQAILAGTESGDFWDDADVAVLQEFVRAALRDPSDGGTARFQHFLSRILDIRGGRAGVYLIDDMERPLADGGKVATRRYSASTDQSGARVWPSATASSRRKSYAGSFTIGAYNVSSDSDARSAFLHELTHLQLETDERPHLFMAGGKSYVYGTDGDHYSNELIPDLSRTFDEAVANSIELLYDEAEARRTFRQFQPDDYIAVEVAVPDPSGVSGAVSPDLWLDDQIQAAGARPFRTSNGYAHYLIGDLPARFIVHNEFVLALVFSEYTRRHIGLDRYVRAIRQANRRILAQQDQLKAYGSRETISSIANFLESLCQEGTGGVDPTEASVSAEPSPALLPLAYLDYFTGLAAQSQAEFSALFDDQLSEAWVEFYWTVGRPAVDSVLGDTMGSGRLTATDWTDLDLIAQAFGVTGNAM